MRFHVLLLDFTLSTFLAILLNCNFLFLGQITANNLVLISETKTFADAQSYCRKNYRDLPSVKSITDNQKVQQAAGGNTVWIGLFRESWKWSDQSNSVYRSWRSGQPDNFKGNESCVALGKNIMDHWDDWNCETSFPFICYESEFFFYLIRNIYIYTY
uniref:C-type lectin domain-containing protein n=1 Tax=Astyanax mexicanus TaxID=7994 RepID=A0A8B9I0I8_ASTMX